jgi:AcrR family transcriptional regulator
MTDVSSGGRRGRSYDRQAFSAERGARMARRKTTDHSEDAGGAPARPRPTEAQRRILEAAMEVFGTKGYGNGSLLEVGQKVGLTRQGILHHYPSKEKLLLAMLEYRDDADVAGLEGQHVPSGEAFFDHLVNTTRINTTRPGVLQAYIVLSADSVTEGHPAQQFFRDRYTGLRAMIVDALHEVAPAAGPDQLRNTASALIGTMDGLQIQWLLDPDVVDMPAAVEVAIRAAIASLRARSGGGD